jgi:dihydrodipicolinate reductase
LHKAKSRLSYAKGVILCAKWLKNKKGFFHIDDYIKELIDV